MAKRSLLAGSTSVITYAVIRDVNGSPMTGLVFNSSGLKAYYCLPGAASVSISLVTQTITGAYSSGGFVEIDSTNMPGLYRLDVPNAALASSNVSSVVCLSGATGMAALYLEYDLWAVNPQDAVHFGVSSLPNAAAAASGGLPILGANSTAISFTGGFTISSSTGTALTISSSGSNGYGIDIAGNGTGSGIHSVGGATGRGIHAVGGATSGAGIRAEGTGGNSHGVHGLGIGTGAGFRFEGGTTGPGGAFVGGGTSGDGIDITTTSGNGLSITPTGGSGIVSTGNGTSAFGVIFTGGTAGVSDGIKAVAGTGGVDIRGNITGNLTGNVSGSVGSVTAGVTIASGQLFIKKNAAVIFPFVMLSSTDHVTPKTGLTVTATRSLDGAAFSACANSVTELSNGWYVITLANTDTNATSIGLRFSATGADDRDVTVYTQV